MSPFASSLLKGKHLVLLNDEFYQVVTTAARDYCKQTDWNLHEIDLFTDLSLPLENSISYVLQIKCHPQIIFFKDGVIIGESHTVIQNFNSIARLVDKFEALAQDSEYIKNMQSAYNYATNEVRANLPL